MELAACRFSPTSQSLPLPIFQSLACAHCLFYIYFVTPPYSQNYETKFCGSTGLLVCPRQSQNRPRAHSSIEQLEFSVSKNCSCENSPYQIYNLPEYAVNQSVQSIELLKLTPSLPPDFFLIVQQCCEAATRCCENVLLQDSIISILGGNENLNVQSKSETSDSVISIDADKRENSKILLFESKKSSIHACPATWDGWQCFERSEPGQRQAKCPNYIFGDRIRNDIDGLNAVTKRCMPNGEWYTIKRKSLENEWTDYSGCVSNETYTFKLFAGLVAFSITVISIIPALFVFSLHRSLKNQPVFIIHRQLLYSFLFSGIFYIFNSLFFAIDGAPGDHLYFANHLSCRLLFTIQLRYFRLSTFSWMLGEGVYLYRLLMCTFSTGVEPLRLYYIACWGLPLAITTVYSILRQTFDNEECWITPTKIWLIEWTITGPCLIALSINLLLMLVIFCVLLKKLRCNPNLEPAQYTKAVRAVFMLVPVFGLHFLITIYRIQSYIHQIINLVLDGLQGFVVVLIVCYTNRTVLECTRTWIQQKLEARHIRRRSENDKLNFKRSLQENHSGIYRKKERRSFGLSLNSGSSRGKRNLKVRALQVNQEKDSTDSNGNNRKSNVTDIAISNFNISDGTSKQKVRDNS